MHLKDIAIQFLQLCARGDSEEAFTRFVAPGFRHHNPHFKGDPDSLKVAMRDNAHQFPQKTFQVMHVLQDDMRVAVHSCVRLQPTGPRVAVFHLLRFERGLIVEMWDVGQAEPDPIINENGMF